MALTWPTKDPNEKLDYDLDWTDRLSGDTVQTSVWSIPIELTNEEDSFTPTSTLIWITGGVIGESYPLTNTIQTVGGRIMVQTVELSVSSK